MCIVSWRERLKGAETWRESKGFRHVSELGRPFYLFSFLSPLGAQWSVCFFLFPLFICPSMANLILLIFNNMNTFLNLS